MTSDSSRPRDMALLLLAASRELPRRRARDQQADLAGLALQRRILDRLVALDPAAKDLDSALDQIVRELGPPTGPTRGVAASIRHDLQIAQQNSSFLKQLLDTAVEMNQRSVRDEG